MPARDETFRERLRRISLLHWGLICIGAAGVSAAALRALHPAANRAEAAGRATGQLLFVAVGLVLIVLHFVRRNRAGGAPRPAATGGRPRRVRGERPAAPAPRPRSKRP